MNKKEEKIEEKAQEVKSVLPKEKIDKLNSLDKEAIADQDTYTGAELVETFLESNPLKIKDSDPNKLHFFTSQEKVFMQVYLISEDITVTSLVLDMDAKEAFKYYYNPFINQEIKRIERELNTLRFSQHIMSLDEMQAYLSSWILDENVYGKNQLTNKEKLQAMKLLEELKIIKANQKVDAIDVVSDLPPQEKLQELSVDALKLLLDANKTQVEKKQIMDELGSLNNKSK